MLAAGGSPWRCPGEVVVDSRGIFPRSGPGLFDCWLRSHPQSRLWFLDDLKLVLKMAKKWMFDKILNGRQMIPGHFSI